MEDFEDFKKDNFKVRLHTRRGNMGFLVRNQIAPIDALKRALDLTGVRPQDLTGFTVRREKIAKEQAA